MKTDFEDPDDDSLAQRLEEVAREHEAGIEEPASPEGYGKLLETYEWRSYQRPGMRAEVRPWCITDGTWLTWTLKIDPRYGKTVNRHADKVDYKGRKVEAWECRTCGQWVVK